jgi:hypothetical protein
MILEIPMLRFMKMVAPEDPATWITVHHRTFIPGKPDPIFPGNAHKKIRSAMADAQYWGVTKGHCVYLSQGMYRNTGLQTGMYPKADRTYPNLVACKNLYIDVDVKEVGGYASTAEVATAVKGFLEWSKLPPPTVIVGSGSGGWHVYWTMNVAFDRAEFSNMAGRLISAAVEYGLLFDRQCTRDATRLLRIPGTWNYKYADDNTPATQVTLEYCAKEHIDIDRMKDSLSQWKATLTHEGKPSVGVGLGVDAHGLPLDENSDLTGGMKREYTPVSIEEVAKHCPFIRNTLDANGANLVGDPQWHTVVALSCHVTDPRETAHKLCRKSPYYTEEGTDAKLATAQLARSNRETIGPPKCDHIAIERDECKTCPHLALHTTPLSVGFKTKQNGHTFNFAPSAIPPGAQPIELPWPYYHDDYFLVYKSQPDTGKENTSDGLVFEYPLLPGAMLEAGKPFQLIFDTIQGEKQVTKRFDTTIVSDNTSFSKAFAAEGLTINVKADLPRQFMSSYIQLLQKKEDTLVTVPAFGWAQDKNGEMGFAFAGEFVSPAGTFKATRPHEGTMNYRVMGDEQVWIDLMKKIITDDRPDLACMVASSFAAPLVGMTGESGLLMGVTSSASGIGKSTALIGAQTVWSNPGGVGGLSDTANYTFNKAATLRHLPVFYDEIKGESQLKTMTQIAFQLTRGSEKGRSDRSGKMRKVNEFKTLCGYAANGSIVAGVREEDKGTDASWLRMFEMEGVRLPDVSPDFTSDVQHLLIGLELNHGGIGRRYATYLGQNHAIIYKALATYKALFGQALGANPKVERFWIGAIATTILSASIANALGVVNFPLNAMKDFMFSEFVRMRKEMAEDPSDYSKDNALRMTIGTFLNEKQPRNMVKLDKTWTNPTRPPKGYANILNDGPDTKWGKLEVQVSGEPLTLRISDTALSEWCEKTKRPKNNLISQMKSKLGAKMTTGMIGSGSRLAGAKENVWVIQATGTIIEEDLEYGIYNKFLPP